MHYRSLFHRLEIGRFFREEAPKRGALGRLPIEEKELLGEEKVQEYSSPVCYAHLQGMRNGFEDFT